MNKVLAIIIGILIVGGVGWLVISNHTAPDESGRQAQFEKAPIFSLQDYSSKTVNFTDFADKPMVINSWATWCPFCKKELPDFVATQKEFGDKVVIIAIDRAESLAIAKGYTDEQRITDV